jgi:hypothetical protein
MGPTNFTELKEKEQNNFSHMTSCPNLQASNGCGSTHTHAWVYKGISEYINHNKYTSILLIKLNISLFWQTSLTFILL